MRHDREPDTDRLLRLLAYGPMTRQQLKARLGRDPHETIRRLIREGAIVARAQEDGTRGRVFVRATP